MTTQHLKKIELPNTSHTTLYYKKRKKSTNHNCFPFANRGNRNEKKKQIIEPNEAKDSKSFVTLALRKSWDFRVSQILTKFFSFGTSLPTQWEKENIHISPWEPWKKIFLFDEFFSDLSVYMSKIHPGAPNCCFTTVLEVIDQWDCSWLPWCCSDFFEEISGASITTGVEDVGSLGIAMTNLSPLGSEITQEFQGEKVQQWNI